MGRFPRSVRNGPAKLAYLRRSRERSPSRAAQPWVFDVRMGKSGLVNDQELHQQIERLVAEEHTLLEKGGTASSDEHTRLGDINVQLDRLWDLLRQRRARAEFGQDPNVAHERSAETVEKYLQ